MKIAIFHNLQVGGGLVYVSNIIKQLNKLNIKVDVFTHQSKHIPFTNKTYSYPLKSTSNIFSYLHNAIINTARIEKTISNKIIENKYDYVFVFPCNIQQCPNLIKYLPLNITYYFYLENLREFYEQTSFDYYSIKKILSRIIRLPLKIQDQFNCKKATNIITDSYYSKHLLTKIYNKKSYVIYPGMINIAPKKILFNNNKKSLSFGILSMLKGHHLSAIINPKVKIYGTKSHENLNKHVNKSTPIYSKSINNTFKKNLFNKHSIYLANQINEPFGLITLEATQYKTFVLGRNESGTCEIINNGNNGILYDTNKPELAKKLFKSINTKETICLYKTTKINWRETIHKIIYIINYV